MSPSQWAFKLKKCQKFLNPPPPNGPGPTVRFGPLLVVRGGLAKMRGIYNFLQKFTKKLSYLAIFQQKNAKLLGVFLKQYKIGLFSKSIPYYILIFCNFLQGSGSINLASIKKSATGENRARIGSRAARIGFKKAKWSEFNSLHTRCNDLDLRPRVKAGMS